MLRYKICLALTIAAATPAFAAAQIDHGEVDGQKFEYTSRLQANGIIHFAGMIRDSRTPFAFDVRKNGHVEGYVGDQAVEYDVARKLRDQVAATLGEGPMVAEATPQK